MWQGCNVVADASALLAFLHDEAGADAVGTALEAGVAISAVNLAEVLSKFVDHGTPVDTSLSVLRRSGLLGTSLKVFAVDEHMAIEIARLRKSTRKAGLSLGDRACLALGVVSGLPVLTADRAWKVVGNNVELSFIR